MCKLRSTFDRTAAWSLFFLVSGIGLIGVSSTKLMNATRNVVLNVLGLYMLLLQGSELVESGEGGSLGR